MNFSFFLLADHKPLNSSVYIGAIVISLVNVKLISLP